MKKLVLTSLAIVAGAMLAHSQGTVSISTTAATVYTNYEGVTGAAKGGSTFYFETLDMTQSQWDSLTAAQQSGAYDLLFNPSDLSLWTDSTVSGASSSLHAGGIQSTLTTANNWAAPTAPTGYNTAVSYDYYTVVGWSANLGTTWSTVSTEIASGNLFSYATSGLPYFGQTAVAYNYAGGGASGLGAVSLWGGSAITALPGSGGLPTTDALTLYTVPEPTTLALAGLGGLGMLFLRRRKG